MIVPDLEPFRPFWGFIFACWCAGVGLFHVALAAGVPWGAASWGGGHHGALPDQLRVASGVAALVLAGVGVVAVGWPFTVRGRRWVLLGAAGYAGVGIVANAMSPSVVERAVWVPLSALGAVLALKAWREARRTA